MWLLEDSAVEAEAITARLGDHAVRWFADGAELLEALAREPAPSVLLLDWELASLSGIEVCRFVRRKHDRLSLPIVMLTRYGDEQSIVEAFDAGANDYVVKPYLPTVLAARVRGATSMQHLHTTLLDALASLEHERALVAESEAKYRRLAQSGVIGIIEADLSGRIVDANDAFLTLVGRTRAELLAGALSPGLDSSPLDERALRELITTGVTGTYEKELVGRDGNLLTVRIAAARLGPRSSRCVGYVLDVTHERQVEADRARLFEAEQRARTDAELASRTKDEFLAIVSHELRTPMNAVLGWASILQARLPPSEESTKALEVIQRNARLQAKMIDDILDVSRVVTGKVRLDPREAHARTIVEEAMEATRPAAEAKGVLMRTELSEVPALVVDPDRIQQVVWNLLTNAVKFTDRGGTVTVRTRLELQHVVIEVEDTGAGIAPENLLSIFDRFRQIDATTTRPHGGLGLGLAIVRHLVEQHGGTVRAASEGLGRGTTMSVRLPLTTSLGAVEELETRSPAAHALDEQRVGSTPSLHGVLTVVVDDDPDSRAFASAALRDAGAQVIECENVDDALLATTSSRPDVIVSDIAMPGQDGLVLIRRLRALPRERGGGTPAVALTAHARVEDVRRCLDAGFQRHLAKPLESSALVGCVASLRD